MRLRIQETGTEEKEGKEGEGAEGNKAGGNLKMRLKIQ